MLAAEIKKKLLIIIMVSTVSAFSIATPLVIWSMNRGIPDPNWIPDYNIVYDDEVTFNFFENRTRERRIESSYNYYGFTYDHNDYTGGFPDIIDFSRINIVDILVNGTVASGRCQGWNIEIKPNTYHNANLRLFSTYQNTSFHTVKNTSIVFNPPAHWEGLGITGDIETQLDKLFYTELDYYAAKHLQMTFWMHAEYPEYYSTQIWLKPSFNLTLTVRFTYDEGYYPQEPKYPNWVRPKLLKTYTDFDTSNSYIEGDRLYLIENGFFKIYSIIDPLNMVLLGQYTDTENFYVNSIIVSGDIAYLSNQGYGLILLNISNPSNIYEISTLVTVDAGGPTSLRDGILYIDNGDSITIVNVTDPLYPNVMAEYVNQSLSSSSNWIQIDGELAYLGAGQWFTIFNISDPYNPEEVYYSTQGPNEALIKDGLLVEATGSGLRIQDFKDPLHPSTKYSSTFPAECMDFGGPMLYVANNHGITVINASSLTNLQILNDLDFERSDHHYIYYLKYHEGLLFELEFYNGTHSLHIFDPGFDNDNDGISDFDEK